eukprot:TRINITY_DN2213_c0_g5_i1.p1 TRINITY_DN2213_c0_g5~~TRINITY_DN2213_c0_g5_i1.p1  ORF type:complete len:177 (+),score=70.37 TRINITY_DN2213_c0_g5_i1:76-606(+)
MADIKERIEEFFEQNPDIDDKAKDALRECSDEMQEAVLARGDISDARNKSAALIARIRDARYTDGAKVSDEKIDEFIEENEIDEKAGEDLRNAPAHVQKAVIERGKLTDCKNTSAALIARIRDAKKGGGWGGGKGGGGKEQAAMAYEMMMNEYYYWSGKASKGKGWGKGKGKWGPY